MGFLQQPVAFVLGQCGQPLDGIIKPLPVSALALEQRLEAGHQVVVRRLGTERRIVGLFHPAVIAAPARGVAAPGRAQLRILLAKIAQRRLASIARARRPRLVA